MFADGFQDASRISAPNSMGYFHDERHLVCQTRTHGETHQSEFFNNLNTWTVSVGGSAAIGIINPSSADPSIGTCVRLASGLVNNFCELRRTITGLPSSFGVMLHVGMVNVGTNPQDCLVLVVQGPSKSLELLMYLDSILLHMDGTYRQLSTHCPTEICENWIEVHDNGNGTHTVSMYQGTQFVNALTGSLPDAASPGLVSLQQNSGANAGRITHVAQFNIGTTQLPDDLLVQSVNYAAPVKATAANVMFLVEDVCDDIVLGTDFSAQLLINGTPHDIHLVDKGSQYRGIIDFTKPVREFAGSVTAAINAGDALAYKAHMLNGKFGALELAHIQLTSIY